MRKWAGLLLASALIVSGSLLLILWEHPLSIIWDDPLAIFWDSHTRRHESGGRLWWMGPLLIAAGAFWIAEDWFGFGRKYSVDSGLPNERPQAVLGFDRDPPKLPPAST